LLRPILSNEGYHDTRGLRSAREGSAIRLLGIVLMRQRPGTTKGIVFIMLEDEFGAANLVINLNIGDRDRAAMIGARLMVAEGRVERETEHAEAHRPPDLPQAHRPGRFTAAAEPLGQ
jgi:error-prone DNA polymerase